MPRRQSPVSVLISCEHASRAVPARWRPLFEPHRALLDSHRGWDPGTAALGRELAARLDCRLLAGRATRLLVDLNRSAGHPRRFSEITRKLPAAERERIERDWWQPHWREYRRFVEGADGGVIHLACHSFTPVLDGEERRVDVGLLYDPSRPAEQRLSRDLRSRIEASRPELRVRMNAPYRGTANGLGQHHRRLFSPDRLVTIELEVNQGLVGSSEWPGLRCELVEAAAAAIEAAAERPLIT